MNEEQRCSLEETTVAGAKKKKKKKYREKLKPGKGDVSAPAGCGV